MKNINVHAADTNLVAVDDADISDTWKADATLYALSRPLDFAAGETAAHLVASIAETTEEQRDVLGEDVTHSVVVVATDEDGALAGPTLYGVPLCPIAMVAEAGVTVESVLKEIGFTITA